MNVTTLAKRTDWGLAYWARTISATVVVIGAGWLTGCGVTDEQTTTPAPDDAAPGEAAFISSDRNFAESLLYQWWGLFEAPDRTKVLPYFKTVFAPDVTLRMEAVSLDGSDQILAAFGAIPENPHAHHLNAVSVTALGDRRYRIDADFVYQISKPDGVVTTGNSAYTFEAARDKDGAFRLTDMKSNLGDEIAGQTFRPSFQRNRARSAIAYYLGVTDRLDSAYERIDDVLHPDAAFHGLVAAGDTTFSAAGDGVLRGREEITRWLASRKENFQWVSHKITDLEFAALEDGRFSAATTMEVAAQPHDGDKISVTLPINIILEDDGERFMRIVRIDR